MDRAALRLTLTRGCFFVTRQPEIAKAQSAGGGEPSGAVVCCCLGGVNMAYGQKISLARRARGYSQEALAEQCGVSRQAVSRWEQEAAYPETEKLSLLSQALDLSLDELSLGGCVGGAKPSSCGKLRMPEAETGAFQGALIKESLKDDTVLDFVGICGVELWQTQDTRVTGRQSPLSHSAAICHRRCKKSLLKGWFADMKRENRKVIVFYRRKFCNTKSGIWHRNRRCGEACRKKGIPQEQMNWPE